MSSTNITAERAQFARARLALIALCASSCAAAYAYAEHAEHGPILCVLRGLTGLPCPGCGLTRALCALMHADVAKALYWNALSLPLVAAMGIASAIAAAELLRGRAWHAYRPLLYSGTLARILAGAIALYHAGRCLYWAHTGVLASEFIQTSWTYRFWHT